MDRLKEAKTWLHGGQGEPPPNGWHVAPRTSGAARLAIHSDAELVRQAQQGCADSMNVLLERHYRRLLREAQRHCADSACAEDLCQVACLKASLRVPKLRRPDAFGGWLKVIVRNEAREQKRKSKKSGTPLIEFASYQIEALSVEAVPRSTELSDELWNAVCQQTEAMNPPLRRIAAFMLEHFDAENDLPPLRTIAAAMGIGQGTAQRHRQAILIAWQRALRAQGYRA